MFQSIPFNNWIRNYCEIIFNQLLKRNIFKIISNQLLNKKNLWINFQLIHFNNSQMKQSNVCNSINIFIVFIIFFVLSYFIAIVTFIYDKFNIDKIIHVYKSGETIFSKFVWKYFLAVLNDETTYDDFSKIFLCNIRIHMKIEKTILQKSFSAKSTLVSIYLLS